jgi:proliferating cell nuclear antigen
MPSSEYVLEIKTVQISPFRTLMTALKDILLETNIVFRKEGFQIVSMDNTSSILVHLNLKAENFEEYYCEFDKIVIGVNMFQLFKLINTIDSNDMLTLYIKREHYSHGVVSFLGMMFENGEIRQCKIQELRLIEPDPHEWELPELRYSSVINMPSADFQKIIRDMSSLSKKIDIKTVGDELIFSVVGPFAKAMIRRCESEGNLEYVHKKDEAHIIQGEFLLKNLGYVIKCTNMCNTIEMMLDNNMPLVVKYSVASLGEIMLCLSPITVDDDSSKYM